MAPLDFRWRNPMAALILFPALAAGLGTLSGATVGNAAPETTDTLTAVAGTYIAEGSPAQNYGSEPLLVVGYAPGETVNANVAVASTGAAQNAVAIGQFLLSGQDDAEGLVLSSSGSPGGRLHRGISCGKITAFSATSRFFSVGQHIDVVLTFKNTGTVAITGTAQIAVRDGIGATVDSFSHEIVDLAPGQSQSFDSWWDTTGVSGGEYRVTGWVEFDAQASDPESAVVSTEWPRTYLPTVFRQ
jgi:hypothetical protein